MIALFLLNLSFLTNKYVANLHSTEGCQAMAAFMHYSMLATFTWFAMNAFHLWLNFYYGDNISIQRYILKVSVTAWGELNFLHCYWQFFWFESDCQKYTNESWLWRNVWIYGNWTLSSSLTLAIPIVLVVTLLILGKYGELAIPSDGHKTTM